MKETSRFQDRVTVFVPKAKPMRLHDRERMLRMYDTSLMLRITEGRTPEGSIDDSSPREMRDGSIGGFSGGPTPNR